MKLQHFVEMHLSTYEISFNRGVKAAEKQNVDGHKRRRWQYLDDAKMLIHRRDFSGAAFLIGYAEGMSEYATVIRVKKHGVGRVESDRS